MFQKWTHMGCWLGYDNYTDAIKFNIAGPFLVPGLVKARDNNEFLSEKPVIWLTSKIQFPP